MADLQNRGARLWTGAAGSVHGICLDLKNPALAEKPVRQALRLGLDRERIKAAGYPTGTRAEALVSPAYTELAANLPTIGRDVAAAGKLLDDAGWVKDPSGVRGKAGQKLSLNLNTWPAKQWQDAMTIAQANWKELGVEARIGTVENARIADTLSGRYDAAPLGWGLTADPTVGLNLLLHTSNSTYKQGGTYNVFHYSNPQADAKLEEALKTKDRGQQIALVKEIQQIAYDDVPFIPTAFPAYQFGARNGISLDETGRGDSPASGRAGS